MEKEAVMGIGALLKGAAGIITGGLGDLPGKIVDTVSRQFPAKMSDAEKKAMEVEIMKVTNQTQIEMMSAWNRQEQQFQDFTKEMEGTASDLKNIPIVGPIVLFMRGAFRPICAYGILYIDFMALSGAWNIEAIAATNADQAWALLWAINICVLTFYFGERAIKNVAPLIERLMKK